MLIYRMSKVVALFLALAGEARAASPCETQSPSTNGGASITVEFHNQSDRKIVLSWVDQQGRVVPYREIEAGSRYTQSTFVNHRWITRTLPEHRCMGAYLIQSTSRTITVRSSVSSPDDYNYNITGIPFATQEQTNWCWAAASTMIMNYYTGRQPGDSGYNRQCGVINWLGNVGQTDCCESSNASGTTCNRPGVIVNAFELVGMYSRRLRVGEDDEIEAKLRASLHRNRPGALAIRWINATVGHVTVMYGMRGVGSATYQSVFDPGRNVGHRVVKNGELYNTNGVWSYTVLTKPQDTH